MYEWDLCVLYNNFHFCAIDIQAWKSSILCFLTFKETLIDLEG